MDEEARNNTNEHIEDIKQAAWDFIYLVFTAVYKTDQQEKNLKKLVYLLKNDETALPNINQAIKSLINDTINGNNSNLKRRLESCYESLYYNGNNAKDDLPYYLKEIKNAKPIDSNNEKLYNNVVTLYKQNYGSITNNSFSRQIADLYQKMDNISKDAEIKIKKEVYPQFITILGIFTAITFAIFGGMNLLSNLFRNMRNTHASLGQALILASVFGFTLWGLIEILFIWISKINLTKDDKDDRDNKKEDCSCSERPRTNDKCLNKNCSNIDCSDEICLNKDCSNPKNTKEKKKDNKKKFFNIFASVFLILIFIFGLALFFS